MDLDVKLGLTFSLVAAATAWLAACQTVYEGKYDIASGWREAKVAALEVDEQASRHAFKDCRSQWGSDKTRASSRFLVLSVREMNRRRSYIVAVPVTSSLVVGNPVYMNVRDCNEQVVPRTERP